MMSLHVVADHPRHRLRHHPFDCATLRSARGVPWGTPRGLRRSSSSRRHFRMRRAWGSNDGTPPTQVFCSCERHEDAASLPHCRQPWRGAEVEISRPRFSGTDPAPLVADERIHSQTFTLGYRGSAGAPRLGEPETGFRRGAIPDLLRGPRSGLHGSHPPSTGAQRGCSHAVTVNRNRITENPAGRQPCRLKTSARCTRASARPNRRRSW
jgi:hypothetical protein